LQPPFRPKNEKFSTHQIHPANAHTLTPPNTKKPKQKNGLTVSKCAVNTLSADGVKIPGPSKYRRLIRETIQGLDGAAPPADTRSIMLDAILDDEPTERLVLSNSNFICIPNRIFDKGVFYALTEPKIRGLLNLSPRLSFLRRLANRNLMT